MPKWAYRASGGFIAASGQNIGFVQAWSAEYGVAIRLHWPRGSGGTRMSTPVYAAPADAPFDAVSVPATGVRRDIHVYV